MGRSDEERLQCQTLEWDRAAKAKIRYADEDMRKSLQTRHESSYARNITQKMTRENQRQVNDSLKEKAKQTAGARSKLEDELEALNVEMAQQFDERDRLKDLLHKQKAPLKVNLQCIEIRTQRPPTENIRDEVHQELKQQKKELETTYNTLRKVLTEVDEAIRRLDDIKARIREDIGRKGDALSLDMQCLSMPRADGKDIPELNSPTNRQDQEWRTRVIDLCREAEQERLKAHKIRAKGVAASHHRKEVDRAAKARSIAALKHKLNHTRMQRSKIEDRLIECSKEITEAERCKGDIGRSLADKEEPFSLACGRLRTRDRRPQPEKLRDGADCALEAELGILNDSIVHLKDKKGEVADEIDLLKRMKKELEADCNAKNKALHLDTLCLRLESQAARGGAMDMGDSRDSGRGQSRSQYYGDQRPGTAQSNNSARSAMSSTSRHRDIMRQLDSMGPGTARQPRPPASSRGSRPNTARSQAVW